MEAALAEKSEKLAHGSQNINRLVHVWLLGRHLLLRNGALGGRDAGRPSG